MDLFTNEKRNTHAHKEKILIYGFIRLICTSEEKKCNKKRNHPSCRDYEKFSNNVKYCYGKNESALVNSVKMYV